MNAEIIAITIPTVAKLRALADSFEQILSNGVYCDVLREAATELEKTQKQCGALHESLSELFQMIEMGHLVRDITRDGDSDWATKMIPFVTALNRAKMALNQQPKEINDNQNPVLPNV